MLLEDLQLVLKVAEFKSITAAAASMDIRSATASAAVKRVETALGVDLFVRTTRQLRLSNAGERYLPQCQQAILLLEKAKLNIRDDQDIVDGELRIAVSSDLGRNIVIPWLDEFMDAYPNLRVKSNISDSNIDFYRDSVDIALRYGSPTDASVYGFKICNIPRVLCATKEYLEQKGMPKHPQDLTVYNGLFYQLQDIIHDVWLFSDGRRQYKIKMNGNRASNDGDLVRRWCVAGKGLAAKSCLDMANDLLTGKVLSIMPGYRLVPTELWLICPNRQSITPAVRLLRDNFREKTHALLKQLLDRDILTKDQLH